MCFAIGSQHLWCRGQPKHVSNPVYRRLPPFVTLILLLLCRYEQGNNRFGRSNIESIQTRSPLPANERSQYVYTHRLACTVSLARRVHSVLVYLCSFSVHSLFPGSFSLPFLYLGSFSLPSLYLGSFTVPLPCLLVHFLSTNACPYILFPPSLPPSLSMQVSLEC